MNSKEIQNLLLLLIIASLILSSAILWRLKENQLLAGYDTYEYSISSISNSSQISLSSPQFIAVNYLLTLSPNKILFERLLPFLFGLFNVALFFLVMSKILEYNEKLVFFASLIMICSPIFISTYSIFSIYFLTIFCILSATLFLIDEKLIESVIMFLLCFIFSPESFLVIILILIAAYERIKSKNIIIPIVSIIIATAIFCIINKNSYPQELGVTYFLLSYLSDLGSFIGFGVFNALLILLGLLISWKNKSDYALIYFALGALIVSSIFSRMLVIYIDILASYYAGIAILKLGERRWESDTLKNYVLLLLACGLLFSAGSYINKIAIAGPYYSEELSLEWIRDSGLPEKKIFSYYEYGFFIDSYLPKSSFIDKSYFLFSESKEKIKESKKIFLSRDLREISAYFDKENIGYVWINRKMKSGQVFKKDDEGLLFIMQNNNKFRKIYDYMDVEIWKYK